MPQATDELREEWGVDDAPATQFLRARGYTLLQNWCWLQPAHHVNADEITAKELRAMRFLVQEWDFGGLAPWTPRCKQCGIADGTRSMHTCPVDDDPDRGCNCCAKCTALCWQNA